MPDAAQRATELPMRPADDVLQRIARSLERIATALEQRDHPRHGDDAHELIMAAGEVAADRVFSSAELIAHAQLNTEAAVRLRLAILNCAGSLNTRKLGRRLQALEGVSAGEFTLRRLGDDRSGALWGFGRRPYTLR